MKDNGENGVANFSCGGELFSVTAGNRTSIKISGNVPLKCRIFVDWLNNA